MNAEMQRCRDVFSLVLMPCREVAENAKGIFPTVRKHRPQQLAALCLGFYERRDAEVVFYLLLVQIHKTTSASLRSINPRRMESSIFHLQSFIVLSEVLAAEGQLVVLQMGQDLLELEEKTFAWLVAVGVHVELS